MKIEVTSPLKGKRILVAASGSIAAVKTPTIVSNLIKAGAEVRCLLTPSAARLVSPISLATLSRNRCYQDEDQWSPSEPKPLHIGLAEWAEIIAVAPLSASSLGRWIHGIGEGLLASVLLAYEGPVIAAAAMNTAMWSNPRVQANWQELEKNPRVLRLSPSSGLLACDRVGDGKMANPELIELALTTGVTDTFSNKKFSRDWTNKRLLVTAGPTIEALDPARLISNRSSGYMGVLLAQAAHLRGAKVDLVHGPLQTPNGWLEGLKTYEIESSGEMQQRLYQLQPDADVIVMAAAVADIRKKDGANSAKASKQCLLNSFEDSLEAAPDLLTEVVKNRTPNQVSLGFAALTGNDNEMQEVGEAKRLAKGCDLLFANPINRANQGFGDNSNGGFLLGAKSMVMSFQPTSKLELAHKLLDELIKLQRNISK